jgi:hypothetical protein
MSNVSNLVDPAPTNNNPNAQEALSGLMEERDPTSKLPDKFKGKGLEDVVKSYVELESHAGKQAQELGELRKLTDAYIRSQIDNGRNNEDPGFLRSEEQLTNNEFNNELEADSFDDADLDGKTVQKIVDKKLTPIQAELLELKKEKFIAKLSQKHGDFEQVVQDKSFQDWVMESPVRIELYKRADRSFDLNAATELCGIWKEKVKVPEMVEQAAKDAEGRNTAFKQAHMETGTTSETPSGKTYRRVDIIELKMKNPERYRMLEPEIMKAYKEKRIV